MIRYADNFIIIAPSKEVLINYVLPKLREFLANLGLTLHGGKTRIVHRDEGVNFLGFNMRVYHENGKSPCIVTPTKEAVKRLLDRVKKILSTNKQATYADIIDKLNPLLRGWAEYYRFSNTKRTFVHVDYRVWKMLWYWCMRRHKKDNKGKQWVKRKYFRRIGSRSWVFADTDQHQLFYAASQQSKARQYVKVAGHNSPLDSSLRAYWIKRQGTTSSTW